MRDIDQQLFESITANCPERVEQCLKDGANVNVVSPEASGDTPLIWACSINRDTVCPEILLRHGADINYCQHTSPLIQTCYYKNESLMRFLLNNGALVNTATHDGTTALSIAGEVKLAWLLLVHGADVNHQDAAGKTPLMRLLNKMFPGVNLVALHIDHGADLTLTDHQGKNVVQQLTLFHHDIKGLIMARHEQQLLQQRVACYANNNPSLLSF